MLSEVFVRLSIDDLHVLRVELYKQKDGCLYFDKLISKEQLLPGDRFSVSISGYFNGSCFDFAGKEVRYDS